MKISRSQSGNLINARCFANSMAAFSYLLLNSDIVLLTP